MGIITVIAFQGFTIDYYFNAVVARDFLFLSRIPLQTTRYQQKTIKPVSDLQVLPTQCVCPLLLACPSIVW